MTRYPVALLITVALGLATTVQAQQSAPSDYLGARHPIGVGGTLQDARVKLRASAAGLPEVSADLDDLGLKSEDISWALDYRWRFKPRWMLVAVAFTFEDEGSRGLEREFNFDGRVFDAGAAVDTELAMDTYILDLMYSAYRGDRLEILLGGGIHAIDMDASLTGRASIGEMERERTTGASDLLAPLPNLRAQLNYALSERWWMGVSTGWLSANYGDYDGSFRYLHPRVGFVFGDHWAATLGYQYVDFDITHSKSSDRETELNAEFTGPTLFLNYRF